VQPEAGRRVSAPATKAELQQRIAELETELAAAQQRNSDLKDSLQSCHATVVQQQAEQSAYRLLNPPRRETQ